MSSRSAQVPQQHDQHDDPGELRIDARNNRDRIVAAAAEAFAERGLDISMAAIARRAGVGVATLFRRFPTKPALVDAVFARQFRDCGDLLEAAVADPDPWRAFCGLLESVRRMQVADRGFAEAFILAGSSGAMTDERISFTEKGFAVLIERAQHAGRLRPDFSVADLVLVLLSVAGVATGPPALVDAGSQRLLGYLIESFATRPGAERRTLPPAPEVDLRTTVDVISRGGRI
ncbi:TetR/AcrR family transcriptional regulator [Microlunatus soli]|uniref:DNA-binding transcriptional regulator, AcrR family n=1 Tax=Microlunatus soli TaxID=630515 RepID=A0A1H1R000_9ACTN|nr:TetR/AcrR family transcriptional regulator [Microlunatus soli]SDS28946.1 DNA-binding transcriptional regulator, AcrR family [Microlunatus soli]